MNSRDLAIDLKDIAERLDWPCNLIFGMYAAGYSTAEIARYLGVDYAVFRRKYLKELKKQLLESGFAEYGTESSRR